MLYYAQGSALVTEDELFDKLDATTQFHAALAGNEAPEAVAFSTGELSAANAVPFQPVGPGKPLTLMIREVYTGKYPAGGLFGRRKDMLLTSAVKSIATFDAKPRAINFLKEGVGPKSRLERPGASEQGTPLVFHSPALLEKSLTLDLEMVFDQFPQPAFDAVGDAFQSAAGIPVFLAQSAYLLAAGALAKIVGAAGEALFDGKPSFSTSEALNIELAGDEPLPAGFRLVIDGNVDLIDRDFRRKYQVDAAGQVVSATGEVYDGNIPYVVLSVDGTPQEEFASFTPTAASAAVLARFLGIKDGQSQALDPLMDALKLYNDFRFRREVDRLDEQLAGLPDGEAKDKLKAKREALLANILEDLLKPKSA